MNIKKIKNWIYYYKWYVLIGAALAVFGIRYIGGMFGLFQVHPDAQVAYVGEQPLSDETLRAIEQLFLVYAGDFNGDGTVNVAAHAYLTGNDTSATEVQQAAATSEIALIGDLNDCESYFFLFDAPEKFQLEWQLIAREDGSCPDPTDFNVDDKVIPVSGLPFDLSVITDENERNAVSALYLGRRCFYTDKKCAYDAYLSQMWDDIAER